MPLALVARMACTPSSAGSGPSKKRGSSSGASKRLMAHFGQPGRDLPAVFQRSGDQDFHRLFRSPKGVKQRPMSGKTCTVLGIETSCDETAAAVVRGTPPGPGEILSNIVFSQTEAHAPYGGVVPEIASRAHLEILDGMIERALADAGLALAESTPSPPRRGPA